MTPREAAVVSAYTGFLAGSMSDFQAYAEEVMERPVFTHEFGDPEFMRRLHEASRADFISLCDDRT